MIINTSLGNSLFKANSIEFTTVTESDFQADISACKEPVIMLVDIPQGVTGEYLIKPLKKDLFINLTSGKMNYIQLTSYGIADNEGIGKFTITEKSGAAVSGKGIKIGFIKHTNVVNH